MENKMCKLKLQPVYPDNVMKIISSLKNTKSCGIDDIDSSIIKLAKNELVPAITHIVNLSITTGKFPQQWKVAKVIPLHKKDSQFLPENYRPVALLCVLSKILERLLHSKLLLTWKIILSFIHHTMGSEAYTAPAQHFWKFTIVG